MNTQKSVFNKISKIEREVESKEVELSEVEKIELASEAKAKELTKDFQRAESGMKEKKRILEGIVQEFEAIDKLRARARKEFDEAIEFSNLYLRGKDRYNSIAGDIIKKANELGVDANNIPSLNELNKAWDEAANAYRPLNIVLNEINKEIKAV